ncbi:MAG: porin [Roseomonas sp.]|nr:porin [Roseomonas sp.]
MRKILLGTTAVVGLALVAPVANAQQARPAAAPAAPPALPATSVAPTGTAAALFQTPVGITGAGPHGNDGVPNVPTTPTTSGLIVRLGGYFEFTYGNVQDDADKAFFRNSAGSTAAGKDTTTNVIDSTGAVIGTVTTPGAAAVNLNNARGRQRSDFRNDAEINLYVDGVAANGMRYGAMLEMQMDNMVSTAGDGTGVSFDELYGFVKGGWGEIRFGQEDSAASLLQVRRPATQGLGESGDWDEFLPSPGYVGAGIGDGNDATKIIYLSPQMMGFDFGVSYAANRGEGERADNASSTTAFQRDFTGLTNEISAALRYRGTFGDVGVQASLAGQFADPAQQSANGAPLASKDQNITTYSAGLLLRAWGFAVGGDYTWGNYRTVPAGGSIAQGIDGSTQYAAGITYTIGALSLGGLYSVAEQDNGATVADRTQTYWGLGAAYVLAPGMTLFGSYNQIKDENIPTAAPTSAGATLAKFGPNDLTRDITVLVAGVRVAF